jgi:hypothetical protein
MATSWGNIPEELRRRAQWCIAGTDKSPHTVNGSGLQRAAVDQPSSWMDFNTAATKAHALGLGIGYVLHEDDPYVCIDLDVKDAENYPEDPKRWTTPEQFDFYNQIVTAFGTYTEKSLSGKGLHLWLLGPNGPGVRSKGIEVYSQKRFMICTGNNITTNAIVSGDLNLINLIGHLKSNTPQTELMEDEEEESDDWYILKKGMEALNAYKFIKLYYGQWQDIEYPSHSEADLAFLSMLAFYSKINEQVVRIFQKSPLGNREKSFRKDYVLGTLKMIRSRIAAEEIIINLGAAQAAENTVTEDERRRQIAYEQAAELQGTKEHRILTPMHLVDVMPSMPIPDTTAEMLKIAPVSPEILHATGISGITWPPGNVGYIAQFIYQASPRPVKEVAIVAALGLMAGICGKAWHIPQSGLNIYAILIARSGVGKEALHSGISIILKEVAKIQPRAFEFVEFSEFRSGQALTKACAANPSFLNVSGEFGRRLKMLADDNDRDQASYTLRTMMTDLYQKSGPQSIVGGLKYSNIDDNVQSVSGVSYSMIGETTPKVFYDSLTDTMMADGFLSRFLIIEYSGQRPPLNHSQHIQPPEAITNAISHLMESARQSITNGTSMLIQIFPEASALLAEFEKKSDDNINGSNNESFRQLWNRAALKATRIAGLLSVAENHYNPSISKEQLEWAIWLVEHGIKILSKKIDSGEVGVSDTTRMRKLSNIIRRYIEQPLPKSYAHYNAMKVVKIIPRSYMHSNVASVSAFDKARNGTNAALDGVIAAYIANGFLQEMDKLKLATEQKFLGKAYRVIRIPDEFDIGADSE